MRKFIIFLLLVYASFSYALTCPKNFPANSSNMFRQCLKDAADGDTIYVGAMTFRDRRFVIDKDVTIIAEQGKAVFENRFGTNVFKITASSVTFKNITIQSNINTVKIASKKPKVYNFYNSTVRQSHSVAGYAAIKINKSAKKILVKDSVIRGHIALNIQADEIIVEDSTISGSIEGIRVRKADTVLVQNSSITTTQGGIVVSGTTTAPINLQDVQQANILGCTITNDRKTVGTRGIEIGKKTKKVSLDYVCISGAYIGIGVNNTGPKKHIDIKHSTISSYASSGIYFGKKAKVNMTQNCLYGNKPIGATIDGDDKIVQNYWTSYNHPDSNPLDRCPSTNVCYLKKLIYDFRFDECVLNSGDTTKNEVNSNYSGILTGFSKKNAIEEKVCNAITFFDNDKAYIHTPKVSDFLNKTATLMFWIKTTQKGDNTAWSAPLIFGKESSGSQNDIFWGWLDAAGHIGITAGDDDSPKSTVTISDNTWHHVALARDASTNDYQIFIDGRLDKSGQIRPIPNLKNLAYTKMGKNEGFSSASLSGYFHGSLDELKIYKGMLSAEDILKIYENEKNGRNYDGTPRECMCPIFKKNVQFDAWDIFRDINDKNISTKIVKKDFNLAIASLDDNKTNFRDFNGSVCVQIVDDANRSISPWKKWQANDKNITTLNFIVPKANKNARASIVWKKDANELCPLSNETNSSKSTDNFAIRPDDFDIITSNKIKAGEDFNITFRGLDFIDKNSTDYNESVGSSFEVKYKEVNELKCAKSTFDINVSKDWSFADGYKRLQNSYKEVGKVDINISDTNLPCNVLFAAVDCKDANASNAKGSWNSDDTENGITIGEHNKTITFSPHHFDVNTTVQNAYNDFTYLSRDLSMSATVDINISAKNADGIITTNYSPQCYAKNIDLNLSYEHTAIGPNPLKFFMYKLNEDSSKEGNKTMDNVVDIRDINKSVFGNGVASLHVKFNFDRNNTQPVNPFDINISDVNISDEDGAREINETNEKNATFFYGRIVPQDIITTKKRSKTVAEIEVYNSSTINSSTDNMIQNSLNWYRNKKHDNNISIGHLYNGKDSEYGGETPVATGGKVNVTMGSISTNGVQDIKIEAKDTAENFKRTIHFETNPWLWYNDSTKPHAYSSSGSCLKHPCLVYEYVGSKSQTFINSGDFNSSDFNIKGFDANETENRGVKVFR